MMSLSSPALDRVQLTQSAACAAQHGPVTDSAHRLAGHMRGADNGENRPPNRPMRDLEPMKKRSALLCHRLALAITISLQFLAR